MALHKKFLFSIISVSMITVSGCGLMMDDYDRVGSIYDDSDDTSQTDSETDDSSGSDSGDTENSTDDTSSYTGDSDTSVDKIPSFTVDGPDNITEGVELKLAITGMSKGVVYTVEDTPASSAFDGKTGIFTWTPTYSQTNKETGEKTVSITFTGTSTIDPSKTRSIVVKITVYNDEDFDSVADVNDNCPDIANAKQFDYDEDGYGFICDPFVKLPVNEINPEGLPYLGTDYLQFIMDSSDSSAAIMLKGGTENRVLTLSDSGAFLTGQTDVPTYDFESSEPQIFNDDSAWFYKEETTEEYSLARASEDTFSLPYSQTILGLHQGADGGVIINMPEGRLDRWYGDEQTTLLDSRLDIQIIEREEQIYVLAKSDTETVLYYYAKNGTLVSLLDEYDKILELPTPGGSFIDDNPTDLYVAGLDTTNSQVRIHRFQNGKLQTSNSVTGVTTLDSIQFIPVRREEIRETYLQDYDQKLWVVINDYLIGSISYKINTSLIADTLTDSPSRIFAAGLDQRFITADTKVYWKYKSEPASQVADDTNLNIDNADVSMTGHLGWVSIATSTVDGSKTAVVNQLYKETLYSETLPVTDSTAIYRSPAWVASDGVVWGNVSTASENYLFSFNEGTLEQKEAGTSQGGDIQLLKESGGSGILYYPYSDNPLYTLQNLTLTKQITPIAGSYITVVKPEAPTDANYTWAIYTTSTKYSLSTLKNGTLNEVMTDIASVPKTYRDSINDTLYIFYENQYGWNIAQLNNGSAVNLQTALDDKPDWINRFEKEHDMVLYKKSGNYYIVPLSDTSMDAPIFWSNKEISFFKQGGRALNLFKIEFEQQDSLIPMAAICSTGTDTIICSDAPPGDYNRLSLSTHDNKYRFIMDMIESDDVFFYRSMDSQLPPPDDCLVESSKPMCSSARINACVCAQDSSCCTTFWSASCAEKAADPSCGS
ncbi:MAG: hypothetical protein JXR91_06970 [Deltaproteobacteria bacterium]|nr:hypothetical protein [Deltaproteobacteria bacterium]